MKIDGVSYSEALGQVVLWDLHKNIRVTLHLEDIIDTDLIELIYRLIKDKINKHRRLNKNGRRK